MEKPSPRERRGRTLTHKTEGVWIVKGDKEKIVYLNIITVCYL